VGKLFSVFAGVFLLAQSQAFAAEIAGMWLVRDGSAKVKIVNCGGAMCGTIAWIKDPIDPDTGKPWLDKHNANAAQKNRPLVGVMVARNMKRDDSGNKWSGQVYSVDHGRSVNGSLTLVSANRLKIEGCMLMICESEIWTRSE
jgi:uncharacterized protein (DUF2147 family)